MSVESKRLRWTEHGDPVLTIVAVGSHDVYRLANHMQKGQCEFAAIGYKVMRGLRRRWTRGQWGWLQDYMHGGGFTHPQTAQGGCGGEVGAVPAASEAGGLPSDGSIPVAVPASPARTHSGRHAYAPMPEWHNTNIPCRHCGEPESSPTHTGRREVGQ